MTRFLTLFVALCVLAGSACATHPGAFTARYDVLRSGQRIGEARMQLSTQGEIWEFVTRTRATAGLAGLLGLDTVETSRFRWRHDQPEMLSYDYRLDSGLKHAKRAMDVDWQTGTVHVDDSRKGRSQYAAQAGMVERQLLILALSQALRSGQRDIALAVAVRDRVKPQHYRVTGEERIDVPAGHFDALRVERSDDGDHAFTAWFAPQRYPVPIKLAHGDKLELRLLGFDPSTTPPGAPSP